MPFYGGKALIAMPRPLLWPPAHYTGVGYSAAVLSKSSRWSHSHNSRFHGKPMADESKEARTTVRATGIVRRIDELGRVVIPKEIRRTLRIREGDPSLIGLTPLERFCLAIENF